MRQQLYEINGWRQYVIVKDEVRLRRNCRRLNRRNKIMYPMINMKATGIRLRQIMNRKNITAKDIQQYLNLSCVQSVYRWLGGHSMPTVDNLYALSELLQVPIDYLIVGNRTYQIPDHNYLFYARIRAYHKGIGRCKAIS